MSSFDWDPEKARRNLVRHGVSFEEAESAIGDACAKWFPDDRHRDDEGRFLVFGVSSEARLLLVVTSEAGPKPRIISAWRATKRERREYEER